MRTHGGTEEGLAGRAGRWESKRVADVEAVACEGEVSKAPMLGATPEESGRDATSHFPGKLRSKLTYTSRQA